MLQAEDKTGVMSHTFPLLSCCRPWASCSLLLLRSGAGPLDIAWQCLVRARATQSYLPLPCGHHGAGPDRADTDQAEQAVLGFIPFCVGVSLSAEKAVFTVPRFGYAFSSKVVVYGHCIIIIIIDRFYIALFSVLEQTHCACMWFYMSD